MMRRSVRRHLTIEVTAKQFAADARGKETKEPLDTWFEVAVVAETDKPLEEVTPLYIEKHRLRSGKQVLTVRKKERPGIVALDPFHKRIERSASNNSLKITAYHKGEIVPAGITTLRPLENVAGSFP